MVTLQNLISRSLLLPADALVYEVSRALTRIFRDKFILETEDNSFNVLDFANAKHCRMRVLDHSHAQFESTWTSLTEGGRSEAKNAFFDIFWNGSKITLLRLDYQSGGVESTRWYLIATNRSDAQAFFAAVCSWQNVIRAEILVFRHGLWKKDPKMYEQIRSATLESLVLGGTLKEDLVQDFERFFAAEEFYKRHGVPWKRGLLLLGPPGNGKTHAIKALVNHVGKPCLYVRSVAPARLSSNENIERVFNYARRASPCVLVFEDLDSLIDGKNRSFFLNEMDGFAQNRGILTIASTNHPDKLDPAILDRPSRFDRKYTFELPGVDERKVFLGKSMNTYGETSDDDLAQLAVLTEGFSFAYLKELVLSAAMSWVDGGADRPILEEALRLVGTLRAQMRTVVPEAGRPTKATSDDEDND